MQEEIGPVTAGIISTALWATVIYRVWIAPNIRKGKNQ